MPIEIDQPIAVPAKTYNEIWVRGLVANLQGCNPGDPLPFSVTYGLVGRDATGVGDFHNGFHRSFDHPDAYALAAQRAHAGNPKLAMILTDLVAELIAVAKDSGVFTTDE